MGSARRSRVIEIEAGPKHGSFQVDAAAGTITYVHDGSAAKADTLTYTLRGGAETSVTTVALSVRGRSEAGTPKAFALDGVYPNPFSREATVAFDLPEAADVRLELYDTLGRRVAVAAEERMDAGSGRRLQVDARGLASGVYLYRLRAMMASDTVVRSGRITVVR